MSKLDLVLFSLNWHVVLDANHNKYEHSICILFAMSLFHIYNIFVELMVDTFGFDVTTGAAAGASGISGSNFFLSFLLSVSPDLTRRFTCIDVVPIDWLSNQLQLRGWYLLLLRSLLLIDRFVELNVRNIFFHEIFSFHFLLNTVPSFDLIARSTFEHVIVEQ